jgi:alkyldihydroxyacetonephosphate synthase
MMRFWGWGDDAGASAAHGLPEHADELLARELDLAPPPARPPRVAGIDDVRVGDGGLASAARTALEAAVGAGHVRTDREARVLHAAGKAYPDLIRLRAGDAGAAPDAVVLPGSHEEVRAVLAACDEHRIAVVPFGGGTSVVGGVEPLRGDCEAVVAVDLGRMDRVTGVDERSLTVRVEPGLRLPGLEEQLATRGLTLGHFPQSFEYATVGGCVAARSSGQASTGYGRIDALLVGARLAAPAGDLDLPALPASAAGPDLRELVAGSEGALGIITATALRAAPRPAVKRYEGFAFASFGEGAEAFRLLEQEGAAPDVARLSDEEETRLQLALAGGGAKMRAAGVYLRARGVAGGCVAVCGWEGRRDEVLRRRTRTVALLRDHGAVALGRSPGEAWARGRFQGPYLRDHLLDRGVLVETLETASQWSGLFTLYRAVDAALRDALGQALVLCHISHLYPSGASLYFTFLSRARPGGELDQWRAAKTAASEAIVAAGGTISHHHGVGRDHAPYLRAETGDLGVAALRAVKAELDPAGIMNPGKLLA